MFLNLNKAFKSRSSLLGATAILLTGAWPVMAQPAPLVQNAKSSSVATLKGVQQADLDRKIAYFKLEKLLQTRISLQADATTIQEIVAQVEKLLPDLPKIQLRNPKPVKLTFGIETVAASSILKSAATLAGCEYLQLSDKVVIAPRNKLTPDELIQLRTVSSAGAQLWAKVGEAAEEVKAKGNSTPLGSLSPEAQNALMQIVAGIQAPGSPNPTPGSAVHLAPDGSGGMIVIDMDSERHRYQIGLPKKKG